MADQHFAESVDPYVEPQTEHGSTTAVLAAACADHDIRGVNQTGHLRTAPFICSMVTIMVRTSQGGNENMGAHHR